MTNSSAKKKLDKFIDLRGSIAQKIKTEKNVWKKDVKEYRNHLLAIAAITHNRVNSYLEDKTGIRPWVQARKNSIK